MKRLSKPILLILGWLMLLLGFIGAILPVMPTTPFAILAAYFFSKSSPRLHQKIRNFPGIGHLVVDWEDHRVIRPKAKILCILTIAFIMGVSIFATQPALWVIILLAMIWVAVSLFVATRKSERHEVR
ncbi:MAG: YbaN family protein [Halobacteriovoraceae bacterium]|nr:YbaN family protein [Halobacteriovoraceae bacterium]MCB9094114.1 YbaN family protein [Halobacteriovoraceae bacterium]